jgi:hypothetical protein
LEPDGEHLAVLANLGVPHVIFKRCPVSRNVPLLFLKAIVQYSDAEAYFSVKYITILDVMAVGSVDLIQYERQASPRPAPWRECQARHVGGRAVYASELEVFENKLN